MRSSIVQYRDRDHHYICDGGNAFVGDLIKGKEAFVLHSQDFSEHGPRSPSHTQSADAVVCRPRAQAKASGKPRQGSMCSSPMYVYVVRDVRERPCLVKAHRPATSTITAGFMAGPAPAARPFSFTSHHQLPSAYSYTLYINTTLPFSFLKASPAAHARRPCGGTRTHKKQVPTRA